MADEEIVEETTSAPEGVEATPVEEPKAEEAPAEEAKCSKCGGSLDLAGKCPVCDVETPTPV